MRTMSYEQNEVFWFFFLEKTCYTQELAKLANKYTREKRKQLTWLCQIINVAFLNVFIKGSMRATYHHFTGCNSGGLFLDGDQKSPGIKV